MVKRKIKGKSKRKQVKTVHRKARKKEKRVNKVRMAHIGANTPHGLCTQRLSAFGGLLALTKFLDLIGFEEIFEKVYVSPGRKPELGCYRMVLGLLMLLFIGFHRLGHFIYIQEDSMLCGILKVARLPVVSTFWRYLQSLGIVQSQSLLRVMAVVRERVWQLVGYQPERVCVNIDTTVTTVYGKIEGARKGHNTKHRGKKGLRPVLCFLEETREYLCGKQRRGETISGKEVARQIRSFGRYLPECVKKVRVRADGEFIGWESVSACLDCGYSFVFGNRRCTPPFPEKNWYPHGDYEYNECQYQPTGWEKPCRFVVMRIGKDLGEDPQLLLIQEEAYSYRVFVTNLRGKVHHVIAEYDQRADVENCIGEAQREGILAIPSKRFQCNHAYFQLVLLAYNLWRWMKQVVGDQVKSKEIAQTGKAPERIEVLKQTIRVSRLKMLFVAAKVTYHDQRDNVHYSIHDSRAAGIIDFLDYLDRRRRQRISWRDPTVRTSRRSVA
jgi:hypothetical protein